MLSIELSAEIERHFQEVVQKNFRGNIGEAFTSLLLLHDKYGWKEQFKEDVGVIRTEVRKNGGIDSGMIDDAITKYRKAKGC
jgi:hypothetical protein